MGVASSSVPCNGCTLCCKAQDVFLLPGEDASHLDVVPDIIPGPGGRRALRLRRQPNGDCVHLIDGACSVYEHRPQVCAGFDCRDFYRAPANERRRRDALASPHDKIINARGRALVEGKA